MFVTFFKSALYTSAKVILQIYIPAVLQVFQQLHCPQQCFPKCGQELHGRHSTSYYTASNGMKSQGDRVIRFLILSNILTRLRRKSPLLLSLTLDNLLTEKTFIGSVIWLKYFKIFCFHCIYFKSHLLYIESSIGFPR